MKKKIDTNNEISIKDLHDSWEWFGEEKEIENPHDLLQKYEDLVWYARKPGDLKLSTRLNCDLSINTPKGTDIPFEFWAIEGEQFSGFSWPEGYHADIVKGALTHLREVEKDYPEETKNLAEGNPDWSHGFNSGCLATIRLLFDFIYIAKPVDLKKFKKTLTDFPELYT